MESKEGPEGRRGEGATHDMPVGTAGVQVKSVSSVERVVCAVRRVVRRAPAAARAQWRRDGILSTGTYSHAAINTPLYRGGHPHPAAHARTTRPSPTPRVWGEISESSNYVRAYLYLSPRYTIDHIRTSIRTSNRLGSEYRVSCAHHRPAQRAVRTDRIRSAVKIT